jgi:hypothetical protein
MYDDGVVVSLASAGDALERVRAEFGTACLGVLRFDSFPFAVVVIEGEPESVMGRTSELLSAIVPDGLSYSDCRRHSIKRRLFRVMGYDGLYFPDDDHCLIPRPASQDQVIHIDGEVIEEFRRRLQSIA